MVPQRVRAFRYLSQFEFGFDLELTDQYHPDRNENNLERLHSFFSNLFLLGEGIKTAISMPKRPAGLLDPVKEPEAGVTPTPAAKKSRMEAWLDYAPKEFDEQWRQINEAKKIKVDIQGAEFTTEEMCLRIPDTNSEAIIQSQQEEEEAKKAAVQEDEAKKAIKEFEAAEKKARADELAAKEKQQQVEAQREQKGRQLRETAQALAAARTKEKTGPAVEPGSLPSPQPASSSGSAPKPAEKPAVQPELIKPYFMGDSYSYVFRPNKFGEIVEHVEIDGAVHPLVTCSGKDLGCQYLFYRKKLNDWLTRANKVVRGHGKQNSSLPFDDEMFLELEVFAKAFLKEVAKDVTISVPDLAAICFRDKKGRFELKCVEGLKIGEPKNLRFWPMKIRAEQWRPGRPFAFSRGSQDLPTNQVR